MPIERRVSVLEHRFDTHVLGYAVRYWIEADPEFGGVSDSAIVCATIMDVEKRLTRELLGESGFLSAAALAKVLSERILFANSVEVMGRTSGACVHRDWP